MRPCSRLSCGCVMALMQAYQNNCHDLVLHSCTCVTCSGMPKHAWHCPGVPELVYVALGASLPSLQDITHTPLL